MNTRISTAVVFSLLVVLLFCFCGVFSSKLRIFVSVSMGLCNVLRLIFHYYKNMFHNTNNEDVGFNHYFKIHTHLIYNFSNHAAIFSGSNLISPLAIFGFNNGVSMKMVN